VVAGGTFSCGEHFVTDPGVDLEGSVDSITTALLHHAKQGDQQAWNRLVDVYLPLVFHWCKKQNLQEADILDVGQDVLLRVSKNLKSFRRDRRQDTFRGWLWQITRNAILDHYRRQRKLPVGQGGSTAQQVFASIPNQGLEDRDSSQADETQILCSRIIDLVRGGFSEKNWLAFQMVMLENQTPAEAAEVLGISRNQVYLAKSRILRRLREELDTQPQECGSGGDDVQYG